MEHLRETSQLAKSYLYKMNYPKVISLAGVFIPLKINIQKVNTVFFYFILVIPKESVDVTLS